MITRIITGALLVVALAALCIFSGTLAFPIVMGVLALMGIHEMLGCLRLRKNFVISLSLYAMAVIMTILSCTTENPAFLIVEYCSVLFIVLLLLFASAVFSGGSLGVDKVCISFTTSVYILTGFLSLTLLRYLTIEANGEMVEIGKYLFLLAFLCPWVTDTFAYFTGMFFGRHKLIPEVSPKKTIEGSVGGTLFCIGFTSLYGYLANAHFANGLLPPVYVFAILGLFIAIVSQIGDLIFSLIKRKYGIKDYGFIFPGHGGVLDRFDSIIAVSPLVLIMCVSVFTFNIF